MKKNGRKKTCRKECLLLTLFLSRTLFLRVGTAIRTLGPFLPFAEEADAIPSGSRANAGKTAWAAYPQEAVQQPWTVPIGDDCGFSAEKKYR